jgi:hypothetical protein
MPQSAAAASAFASRSHSSADGIGFFSIRHLRDRSVFSQTDTIIIPDAPRQDKFFRPGGGGTETAPERSYFSIFVFAKGTALCYTDK